MAMCYALTAFAFPAFLFAIFFILNLFVWGEASTAAVPFGTMVAVMALWFGVSVPLTFFGAFLDSVEMFMSILFERRTSRAKFHRNSGT